MAESSWEPAASIPSSIIEEFEEGVQREVQKEAYTSGGQTIYTLSSMRQDKSTSQSKAKKPRLEQNSTVSSNSG